jgi:hypothetical protein
VRDEQRAESIVRALHGKVPPWASGAVVTKASEPFLPNADVSWIADATFEAVGQTGVRSCCADHESGVPRFHVFRRPSRQAIRKYCAPTFPVMLEGIMCGYCEHTVHALAALVQGEYVIVSSMTDGGPPRRFDIRERFLLAQADWHGLHGVPILNPEGLLASQALQRRYEWSVAMRVDGSPALRFACSPGSARNAFRLRDLPPGKNRRDALIHWVCEHYRNPDIHVSEHLRGKHVFSWRGIECEIVPSAFDREKEIARKLGVAS